MSFSAFLLESEQAHCLRLVEAGASWDAFVLDKARALERKRAYRGITGFVEQAICDAGRKLPKPWVEPSFTEVFDIPANYGMPSGTPAKKGAR